MSSSISANPARGALVTHDGHAWKLCQLCERRFLSDPGAWGSFGLCLGCWNTFARAGVYPQTSPSLLVAAVERGEVVLRPEVRVRPPAIE